MVHALKNNTYTTRLVLGEAELAAMPEGSILEVLDVLLDLAVGETAGHERADEAATALVVGNHDTRVILDAIEADGDDFADVESNGRDNSHAYLH